MDLLASCSVDEALSFEGRLVLPNEDSKKPNRVYLNVVVGSECSYSNEEVFEKLSSVDKNVLKSITFMVDEGRLAKNIPDAFNEKVFNEYTNELFLSSNTEPEESSDIVKLVRVDKDFSDMRYVLNSCKQDKNVRFIGGKLLNIDGVRIGRFDSGKEKMSPYFEDMYDNFVEVELNNLKGIQEIVKKVRKKAKELEGNSKDKKVSKLKSPRKPKRLEVFNSLFADNNEDEF